VTFKWDAEQTNETTSVGTRSCCSSHMVTASHGLHQAIRKAANGILKTVRNDIYFMNLCSTFICRHNVLSETSAKLVHHSSVISLKNGFRFNTWTVSSTESKAVL